VERFTLRTDGFVSVHAGYAGGEFVTKPLIVEGNKMLVNFATSAAGSIRFQVEDLNGNPLSGLTVEETKLLYGDQIAAEVRLQSPKHDPKKGLEARPVRLRFFMKDADLYSVRFVE
jgi:hypothetical protein